MIGMPENEIEALIAIKNLDIIQTVWDSKKDAIAVAVEAKAKQDRRKNAWRDSVGITEEEVEGDTKLVMAMLKSLCPDSITQPSTANIKKVKGVWIPPQVATYLLKLLEADEKKALEEYDANLTPTRKKTGTGKKSAPFQGEKVIKNPDAPEGDDYKFYFKGDEDATFTKPSGKPKDGKQTLILKAVKSKRYLGGSESSPDDGKCCGAVGWDRAQGSKAIKATGLSYAMFKQRCSNTRDVVSHDASYCSKCAKKPINFFTDTYKISKGEASKFNGVTFKEFIENNLEYGEQ